jgi:hypothetical protein
MRFLLISAGILTVSSMRSLIGTVIALCLLFSDCDAAELQIKTTFMPSKCDRKAKAGDRVRSVSNSRVLAIWTADAKHGHQSFCFCPQLNRQATRRTEIVATMLRNRLLSVVVQRPRHIGWPFVECSTPCLEGSTGPLHA